MDSLDGTSFDSGGSAAILGCDPGSSSDATSPDAPSSWGRAMADAGADGGSSADDTGWGNTGSPWDSGATAAASAPSQDSTWSQTAEQSAQDSASEAQAMAAGDDARAAQASLDANAILRGMEDRQAAGSSAEAAKSWQVADRSPTPAAPLSPSNTVAERVLGAAAEGAAKGFGSSPLGLSENAEEALRRNGIYPPASGGGTPLQNLNEAVGRPVAAAADLAFRSLGAVFGAYQGGVAQAGEEVGQPQLGRDLAALPEAFAGDAGGLKMLAPEARPVESMVPEVPRAEMVTTPSVGATTAEQATNADRGVQANEQEAQAAQSGGRAAGKLTGSLSELTEDEKDFVHELLNRGHDVEVVPTAKNRTPDFKVDGLPTELKTLSGVTKQTSDGLSAALASRIMDARGQAETVIVDARKQPGMTQEIAQRGIGRAIGADNRSGGKIQSMTVLTLDGTAVFRRQ